MPDQLSEFILKIHLLSAELHTETQLGILPDLEDWNSLANLFSAAQLLWWSQYREASHSRSSDQAAAP